MIHSNIYIHTVIQETHTPTYYYIIAFQICVIIMWNLNVISYIRAQMAQTHAKHNKNNDDSLLLFSYLTWLDIVIQNTVITALMSFIIETTKFTYTLKWCDGSAEWICIIVAGKYFRFCWNFFLHFSDTVN